MSTPRLKRPAGRPKKVYTPQELARKAEILAAKMPGRGRGRPRKEISAEEAEERANRPAKPRGRPRKPEGAEKSTYRKKYKSRGRPPKIQDDIGKIRVSLGGKSTNKSPGRPKKISVSSLLKSPGGKRGRPKKSSAKTPRGRPKKSLVGSSKSPAKATGGKRGRPKKSTPKPPAPVSPVKPLDSSGEDSSPEVSDSE